MRGENFVLVSAVGQIGGSPPLARGKLIKIQNEMYAEGITPACAGKTVRTLASGYSPHGSPPLARGKPNAAHDYISGKRITPACAGKTDSIFAFFYLIGDHPRLRGENF